MVIRFQLNKIEFCFRNCLNKINMLQDNRKVVSVEISDKIIPYESKIQDHEMQNVILKNHKNYLSDVEDSNLSDVYDDYQVTEDLYIKFSSIKWTDVNDDDSFCGYILHPRKQIPLYVNKIFTSGH